MTSVLGKLLETFSSKKPLGPKETAARERHARDLINPNGLSSARINSTRVRLVVFRDDKGVKQQLFDSQSNAENNEEQCSRSLCDMRSGEQLLESSMCNSTSSMPPSRGQSGGLWTKSPSNAKTRRAAFIRRPSTDAELLGEMMFGSMPMKTVGNTVKVHYIRSTDQLMLTKVFTTHPRSTMPQCCLSVDYNSDSCPLNELSNGSNNGSFVASSSTEKNGSNGGRNGLFLTTKSLQQMRSVSPDTSKHRSSSLSVPILRPNGSGSSLSPSTTPPSPHSPHQLNGSNGLSSSLTRRILRSRSTSLENGNELYRRVLKPLDQNFSRKGKKYACGVIICLSELSTEDIRRFQSFLFSHFTLIDAHLERLKEAVEEACHFRGNMIASMLTKGYQVFLNNFLSLYEAPRIESPVWLSLVIERERHRSVCMQFMEELGSAIMELETKDTKFFLSSLLTAVLTHHLAWVYTVGKQSSDRHHKSSRKSLGVLAESHPYNPLWAQLGDLYGAVSHPLKIARTVVTGQSVSVVCRLLYLLTYFIRCSEIQPGFVQTLTQELADKDETLHKQSSADGTVQPDSESQTYDSQYALEDSDLFPVSRASSCTVVSEQEKRVLSPATSMDRDTPIIKPHPFSIRATPHSTSGTCGSTDSFHRRHASSESECYEQQSDSVSLRALRSKSNSLNYSGEYSCSSSVPSGSLKNSPLLCAKLQQYGTVRSHMTTDFTVSSTANTLCSCNSRDHPVASKDNEIFGYRQFHCQCHYGDPRSCAVNPVTESTGTCPINQDFVKFDVSHRYGDQKLDLSQIVTNTLPSRNSSNVSLSSNFSQSPHQNTQLPVTLTSSSPPYPSDQVRGGPFNQSPKDTYGSNSAIRASCTSIDSGYEKSMSMSSFTSSAREPGSSLGSGGSQPQYGSTGDVTSSTCSSTEPCVGDGEVLTKPRARSLCDMEQRKESRDDSLTSNLLGQGVGTLYPKLPTLTPQVVVADYTSMSTLTNQQAMEAKLTTSVASTCSSDTATPVGPLSKSATPSPTNSVGGNPANLPSKTLSKAELKRAFFAGKSKKALGIRTIEDSQQKQQQQQTLSSFTRPRSQAISYTQDNRWKTKSCEAQMTSAATNAAAPTISDNHLTSTPTYFGSRTLGSQGQYPHHPSDQCNQFWGNGCTSSHCPVNFECPTSQARPCDPQHQTSSKFGVNPLIARFDPQASSNSGLPHQPTFGSPSPLCFKSGPPTTLSLVAATARTLIFPSDAQSVISETDSGHCTRSIDDRSQADVDGCSQASELSNLDYASEYSELDNDVFGSGVRQRGGAYARVGLRNQPNHLYQRNQCDGGVGESMNPESSLNAAHLKQLRSSPSLLQQRLREYEHTMYGGGRPRMLEQFDDFCDVELPTFDEFCLDESPSEIDTAAPSHRHRMGDFGHSLFAGHSESYLPDFILHGTSEPANDAFLNKLADDLSNMVKHSIIDEPINYGVGIIASTDNWSVKIMSTTKNLHTSDIIVGMGTVKPSQYVKQLLGSVKSMYEMRMPPEFCLSYLEDRLLELNERSQLLTKSLQENPQDADLAEMVPKAVNALNIHQSDVPLILAVSAANCSSADVSAYLNYNHMKLVLGKQFI